MMEAEPPKLHELKNAIPNTLFVPVLWKSMSYVIMDVAIIVGVFQIAVWLELHSIFIESYHSSSFWSKLWASLGFWFAQGTMFWAIFVLGHDCGHGSFSSSKRINYFMGHLLHSAILVPFHPWRISHRKHHKNTGNIDKDEIFYPVREYRLTPGSWRFWLQRYLFFGFGFAWPLYLIFGYEGKINFKYSHFNPKSRYFLPHERTMVVESLIWWSASFVMNLWWFSKLDHGTAMWIFYFGIPYIVFASWLVLVTFLHHNQPGTTWFSDSKWSYVKGNLVTIDRNYGLIEQIHHNIGTHLVHHLFPKIPHYHLREATKYLLPVVEPHRVAASESARIIPTYFYNWRVYSSHFTTPNNSLSHSYPK